MKKDNIFVTYWRLLKAIPPYITVTLVLSVIGMNLLAQFTIVSLPYLALNGGLFLSWLTFLLMDVVAKHYGAKAANFISILAITINILVGLIFYGLGQALHNPAFDIFSVNQWSIITASTIAFIVSALVNNFINVVIGKRIKINPSGKLAFVFRSSVSTFIGQVLDNFIFIFLAFYLLPMIPVATQVHWTIAQCIGCSIFGAFFELLTELIFTPFGYMIVRYWKKHLVGLSYIKTTIKLDELSAHEIGELVNDRYFTPLEVVKFFEKRINKYNKDINAFTYTKFKEAEEAAIELGKRIENGENVGPFAGVPFALKDFLDSKPGWSNSCGGIKSIDRIDQGYSPFTKAMEELGAIAIGKCNAPSYGFRGLTDNYRYGATKNPFNFEYNSGGSSGGSAASVAYGLVPIAEGGDAGGSIRIPAAFTNTFGFKASRGTVPSLLGEGIDQELFPFCMGGGLTKSVKDSCILLNKMQGYDARDPYSEESKNLDYVQESQKPLKGLKVAYTDDFGIFQVHKEMKKYIYKKAKSLKLSGASVTKIDFPLNIDSKALTESWLLLVSLESHMEIEALKAQGKDITKDLSPEFLYWDKKAALITEEDKKKYLKFKEEIRKAFDKVFAEYDLIISPISALYGVKNSDDGNTIGPSTINGYPSEPLIGFALTHLINFVGYPACSIPAGLNKDKFPVGMQMIAPLHKDEIVLRAAYHYDSLHRFKYNYKYCRNNQVR